MSNETKDCRPELPGRIWVSAPGARAHDAIQPGDCEHEYVRADIHVQAAQALYSRATEAFRGNIDAVQKLGLSAFDAQPIFQAIQEWSISTGRARELIRCWVLGTFDAATMLPPMVDLGIDPDADPAEEFQKLRAERDAARNEGLRAALSIIESQRQYELEKIAAATRDDDPQTADYFKGRDLVLMHVKNQIKAELDATGPELTAELSQSNSELDALKSENHRLMVALNEVKQAVGEMGPVDVPAMVRALRQGLEDQAAHLRALLWEMVQHGPGFMASGQCSEHVAEWIKRAYRASRPENAPPLQKFLNDPEPAPEFACINESCGWSGPKAECVHPMHDPGKLLCPECYEVVEQDLPDKSAPEAPKAEAPTGCPHCWGTGMEPTVYGGKRGCGWCNRAKAEAPAEDWESVREFVRKVWPDAHVCWPTTAGAEIHRDDGFIVIGHGPTETAAWLSALETAAQEAKRRVLERWPEAFSALTSGDGGATGEWAIYSFLGRDVPIGTGPTESHAWIDAYSRMGE